MIIVAWIQSLFPYSCHDNAPTTYFRMIQPGCSLLAVSFLNLMFWMNLHVNDLVLSVFVLSHLCFVLPSLFFLSRFTSEAEIFSLQYTGSCSPAKMAEYIIMQLFSHCSSAAQEMHLKFCKYDTNGGVIKWRYCYQDLQSWIFSNSSMQWRVLFVLQQTC